MRDLVPTGGPLSVEEAPDIASGFVARSTDGTVTIDATLAARLERRRRALALAIIARVDART